MDNNMLKDAAITFGAGIFIGVALFDALPNSMSELGFMALAWMLVGGLLWWLQKVVISALKKPAMPPLAATALWLHSLVEGLVTGLAFGVSQTFGIAVVIGMVLHLLPEFFAAFVILRGSGAKKHTSVWVPFVGYGVLFASFTVTFLLLPEIEPALPVLGAISGGAFLYVGFRILRKYPKIKHTVYVLAGVFTALLFILIF